MNSCKYVIMLWIIPKQRHSYEQICGGHCPPLEAALPSNQTAGLLQHIRITVINHVITEKVSLCVCWSV